MHEKAHSKPIGLNNGSALILMLFSVLCLTVLAALSMISANSQWNLAQRSADSVTAYYAADLKASEIYEEILSGVTDNAEAAEAMGIMYYGYSVEIDENSSLEVFISETNGNYEILKWKAVQNNEWIADESLPIWDGTIGE